MQTRILTERLDLSEGRLDAENRIIYGVVLIRAGMSKNRRYYGEDVLRAAAPIFEHAKAYLNHPARQETNAVRSLRDLSGWYANVTYHDGALYADRYFTRTLAGQDAWAIAEDIVTGRAPATLAGLSINAVGQGTMQTFADGEAFNVECITAALSVDDVSEAAAGGSYGEPLAHSDDDSLTAHLLAALTYEEWSRARPDFLRRLQNEMKTVRQDEAVRSARAETEHAVQALAEAQEALAQVQRERDAARRALEIERLTQAARIPGAWRESLAAQLDALPGQGDDWITAAASVIAAEEAKARSAGYRAQSTAGVAVNGAGQQVYSPPPDLVPLPAPALDMNRLRSPEELAAVVRRIQSIHHHQSADNE